MLLAKSRFRMDKATITKKEKNRAIERAVNTAKTHLSIKNCSDLYANCEVGGISIDLCFKVNLANCCRAKGVSPTDVKEFETVRVDFPEEYPWHPPELSLRPDFSRDNAHIQPWLTKDDRPVPCLVDGSLEETFIREGFIGLLNRTAQWLDKAADGTLIDFSQGWEPTRRDFVNDIFICDALSIRERIDSNAGQAIYGFKYFQYSTKEKPDSSVGEVFPEELDLEILPHDSFLRKQLNSNVYVGQGPAVLVWPDINVTTEVYRAETVFNIKTLNERAEFYGCSDQLLASFLRLEQWAEKERFNERTSLLVLLCARRPFDLVNEDSSIEISPYIINDTNFRDWNTENTKVRPAADRKIVEPKLLKRLSGCPFKEITPKWTLIGAGSVGSKLALHCARSGSAPSTIVDKNLMSPHNAARHALIPDQSFGQINWMQPKAAMLNSALLGLGQSSLALKKDICQLVHEKKLFSKVCPDETKIVVNTTASFAVREVLSFASNDVLATPVAEMALYGAGKVGLIVIEGENRDPKLGDLIAEFYLDLMQDEEAASYVFDETSELERVRIGEGCGSVTLPVTDANISLFAAGMAELLRQKLSTNTIPSFGEIHIGKIDQNGLGISWSMSEVPPIVVVEPDNETAWQVRLHPRAEKKISKELQRWTDVETGGILIGRTSDACEIINIVDVLPAPADSTRSANEFVLGIEGVKTALDEVMKKTNGSLYCVGTWHSHLSSTGPSKLDMETASVIAESRSVPSVLLIHTPSNYRVLVAETV